MDRNAVRADAENVVELRSAWEQTLQRDLSPADRERFERNIAEILAALGRQFKTSFDGIRRCRHFDS